jgi:hypothetical protein
VKKLLVLFVLVVLGLGAGVAHAVGTGQGDPLLMGLDNYSGYTTTYHGNLDVVTNPNVCDEAGNCDSEQGGISTVRLDATDAHLQDVTTTGRVSMPEATGTITVNATGAKTVIFPIDQTLSKSTLVFATTQGKGPAVKHTEVILESSGPLFHHPVNELGITFIHETTAPTTVAWMVIQP